MGENSCVGRELLKLGYQFGCCVGYDVAHRFSLVAITGKGVIRVKATTGS